MAILQGDIKLLASKVMLDVPEGGGGPTATVIPDGVSNAVFPDISALDRTNGRVNARQLHVTVQTGDTATFLGSNVIVAEPPNDPNVSITLFSTGQSFDTRTQAIARIEAYLSIGTAFAGYLFGNHVAGQRAIQVLKAGADMPAIGDTLVLTKHDGAPDEAVQYVRVTTVTATERTFADADGEFKRYVGVLGISDVLRYDFPGFDASRAFPTQSGMALRTKMNESTVADAAKYYGVTTLETAAALGDFTIRGASIFTQLVPSAQIETPVADARANQVSSVLIAAGDEVYTAYDAFTLSSNILYIGGAITPGSLRLVPDPSNAVTVSDTAGILYVGGAQVGTVDYANGIITFFVDRTFGGYYTWRAYYKPAAVPASVNQSQGFAVTQANRSLNFVRTIEPSPLLGTLNISYRAGGRWYVLRDDGSGALRGVDSSFGAGVLNPTSGTISVTLGALPDVGSAIILQWVSGKTALDSTVIDLGTNNKFYWAINSDGVVGGAPGGYAFTPGNVEVVWSEGSATKTSTDNGSGLMIGDATGRVDYANGIVYLSPNTLPTPGEYVTVRAYGPNSIAFNTATTVSGANLTFSLGGAVAPGSVAFTLPGQMAFSYSGGSGDYGEFYSDGFHDDGSGGINLRIGRTDVPVGTVNYTTGVCQVAKSISLNEAQRAEVTRFATMYENIGRTTPGLVQYSSGG